MQRKYVEFTIGDTTIQINNVERVTEVDKVAEAVAEHGPTPQTVFKLPVTAATRDMFRSGIKVCLFQEVKYTAVDPLEDGADKVKTADTENEEGESPETLEPRIEVATTLLGEAMADLSTLLNGRQQMVCKKHYMALHSIKRWRMRFANFFLCHCRLTS